MEDENLQHLILFDDYYRWEIVKKVFSSTSINKEQKEHIFSEVEITDFTNRVGEARVVCDAIVADKGEF